MRKFIAINLPAVALAVALAFSGGVAAAKGGGGGGGGGGGSTTPPTTSPAPSGTWPAAYPLPTSPGTVISQSSTRAAVRSTDSVSVVLSKLDNLYIAQKGCTERLAVNKPKDYFCTNATTHKTDEVYFTFAALDVTATNPYRSQSNAFLVAG